MIKWVRLGSEWHHVSAIGAEMLVTACDRRVKSTDTYFFSGHDPVEDECRLCRRALDGGKQ